MMDALKFIEERNRMCDYYRGGNTHSGCAECPALEIMCSSVKSVTSEYIAAVEQWSKEHPRKTRQDVFLEQWPEADLDEYDVLRCCPYLISPAYRESEGLCKRPEKQCTDCRREFWMQEVE